LFRGGRPLWPESSCNRVFMTLGAPRDFTIILLRPAAKTSNPSLTYMKSQPISVRRQSYIITAHSSRRVFAARLVGNGKGQDAFSSGCTKAQSTRQRTIVAKPHARIFGHVITKDGFREREAILVLGPHAGVTYLAVCLNSVKE